MCVKRSFGTSLQATADVDEFRKEFCEFNYAEWVKKSTFSPKKNSKQLNAIILTKKLQTFEIFNWQSVWNISILEIVSAYAYIICACMYKVVPKD